VALFSDIDWVIIAAVAAFLLLGKDSGDTLRMLGRWYGRASRLKQELLSELTKAADLPPSPGPALSIRGALLGLDAPASHVSGIPAAVRVPPVPTPGPVPPPPVEPTLPWTGGYPMPTWSTTAPVDRGDWGGNG